MVNLAADSVKYSIPPTRFVSEPEVKAARILDLESSLPQLIDLSHMGIFVAEDEKKRFLGHVMGFVGDVESVTAEKQGWIFDLAVASEFRGRGVGRKLVETFLDFAKNAGFRFVGLLVTSSNTQAVNLYENLGFIEERKRMAKRLF